MAHDEQQAMTSERLAEIRARVEAATPGPWTVDGDGQILAPHAPFIVTGEGGGYGGVVFPEDGEFIAHARNDMPALLILVDQMERSEAWTQRKLRRALSVLSQIYDHGVDSSSQHLKEVVRALLASAGDDEQGEA